MAMPFVQGRLTGRALTVEIETECGHCGAPLHLRLGSDMAVQVAEADAAPLLFEPHVDWANFREPDITRAY